MLTFIIENTCLNIIAALQDTDKGYQCSGAAKAVVSVLAFRYVLCLWSEMRSPRIENVRLCNI